MEHRMIPLLAKIASPVNEDIDVCDESAEDDRIFQAMLIGTVGDPQAETKITRTQRETADEN